MGATTGQDGQCHLDQSRALAGRAQHGVLCLRIVVVEFVALVRGTGCLCDGSGHCLSRWILPRAGGQGATSRCGVCDDWHHSYEHRRGRSVGRWGIALHASGFIGVDMRGHHFHRRGDLGLVAAVILKRFDASNGSFDPQAPLLQRLVQLGRATSGNRHKAFAIEVQLQAGLIRRAQCGVQIARSGAVKKQLLHHIL